MIRLLLLLVLLAAPAAAQDRVRVMSGEHPGFSRLVFTPSRTLGWQLAPDPEGYLLSFDDPVRFEAEGVFRRIPRDRVLALEPAGQGRLRLRTPPRTPAQSFLAEDRRSIVIDFADALPEAARAVPAVPVGPRRYRPSLPPLEDVGLFWRGVPEAPATDRANPEPAVAAQTASAGDPRPQARPEERAKAVEQDLLDQLARAAAQGLITVDPTALPKPEDREPAPRPVLAKPEADPLATDGESRPAPVEAETSMDRALGRPSRPEVSPQAHACLDDGLFDLTTWSDERPFAEQLGERRAAVMTDLDTPDPKGVLSLARFYVANGFGAEADELLAVFPPGDAVDGGATPVVRQMARLVDGVPIGAGPLSDQAGCAGLVAPWAALAGSGDPRVSAPRSSILRGLAQMPLRLRRELGPALAERFLAAGDSEAARVIRDSLFRAPGEAGSAAVMLDASVEASDGAHDAAAERLSEVGHGEEPRAPEAMVALFRNRLSAGEEIAAGDILLVQAQAFSHRGTGLGKELRAATMRALVASGRMDDAFAEHALSRADMGADAGPAVDHDLLEAIAGAADEMGFLGAAFRALPMIEALPADDPLRPRFADRIAAAGFETRAAEISPRTVVPTASEPELPITEPAASLPAPTAPQEPAAAEPVVGPEVVEAVAAPPVRAAPTVAEGRTALDASRATRDRILEALQRTAGDGIATGAP